MMFGRRKARTPEALARKVGIDPAGLDATVRQLNDAIAAGRPDEFGKADEDRVPLLSAPFMAIDVGLAAKLFPCPTLTLGGLAVDEDTGLVRRADGSAVAGLYAAGRTAVGVSSGLYVSGLSIADGVFSGRRAGLHAARGITWSPDRP
jgi:3-oxo-5alpha-steroid 4-dehydrogenase